MRETIYAINIFVAYTLAPQGAMTADPLTPLSYHILLALADEERHGYGILKEIEERAGSGASPSTGALYLALQRLEEEGAIALSSSRPGPDDDQRRKYYRLTDLGRALATDESRRLEALVHAARAKALLPNEAR